MIIICTGLYLIYLELAYRTARYLSQYMTGADCLLFLLAGILFLPITISLALI